MCREVGTPEIAVQMRWQFLRFCSKEVFFADFAVECFEREKSEGWKAGLSVLCKLVLDADALTHHLSRL